MTKRMPRVIYGAFSVLILGGGGGGAEPSSENIGVAALVPHCTVRSFRDDHNLSGAPKITHAESTFPDETMLFPPLQCKPEGRTDDRAQRVLIVGDVQQTGEDPILAFDGF